MSKTTRKSQSRRKTDSPSWHFRFTPEAAALAGRIADSMTVHFRGAGHPGPDPIFMSREVIGEAFSEGMHVLCCRYLHDTTVFDHTAIAIVGDPPLPLPLAAKGETASGLEIEELRTRVERLERMAAEVVIGSHARGKRRR